MFDKGNLYEGEQVTDYDAELRELIGQGLSNVAIGKRFGVSEFKIRQDRKRLGIEPARTAAKLAPKTPQGDQEFHRPDGTADYQISSDTAWGYDDFRAFIESKGQDPDEVEFSWGVTSTPNGGYFNKLQNVRPKKREATITVDTDELVEHIRSWRPTYATPGAPITGTPEGFIVALSDWQIGKSYGPENGTAGTIERLHASLDGIVKQITRLRAEGRNLRTLHLANLGDHIENVTGSYSSQTYEVDLNLRDQIETALELNMLFVKTLAPLFEHVVYTANPCNHAQLTRGQGKSNVTDDADNATGLLAELVRQMCNLTPHLAHVEVRVPRGEMITPVTVEGVNIATAHGHKITGNEETWLAKQSQRLVHEQKFITDLWLVAHRHSLSVDDFGPYSRIQATTVDPGSKWFTDAVGNYARPGTTIFTVQDGRPGLWDDLKVI